MPVDLLYFSSLLFFLLPGQRTSIVGDVPAGDPVRGVGIGDLMKLSWLENRHSMDIPGDPAFWKVGIENSERGYSHQPVETADFLVKSPISELFSADHLPQKSSAFILVQFNKGSTLEKPGTGLVESDEQLVLEGR